MSMVVLARCDRCGNGVRSTEWVEKTGWVCLTCLHALLDEARGAAVELLKRAIEDDRPRGRWEDVRLRYGWLQEVGR